MRDRSSRDPNALALSAQRAASWIAHHSDLLSGLVQLRMMGDGAQQAVDGVLAVPQVKRFRLSWELWQTLSEGDGLDVEEVLVRFVGFDALAEARFALWGIG